MPQQPGMASPPLLTHSVPKPRVGPGLPRDGGRPLGIPSKYPDPPHPYIAVTAGTSPTRPKTQNVQIPKVDRATSRGRPCNIDESEIAAGASTRHCDIA